MWLPQWVGLQYACAPDKMHMMSSFFLAEYCQWFSMCIQAAFGVAFIARILFHWTPDSSWLVLAGAGWCWLVPAAGLTLLCGAMQCCALSMHNVMVCPCTSGQCIMPTCSSLALRNHEWIEALVGEARALIDSAALVSGGCAVLQQTLCFHDALPA